MQYDFIDLQETESTNSFAKDWVRKNKPHIPTVIFTHTQKQGRGQGQNAWISAPKMNLTFSLIIKHTVFSDSNLFNLICIVAISCIEFLQTKIDANKLSHLKIKWMNDLMYEDKKMGGILIENILMHQQLEYSIIGIGININQIEFPETLLKKATSLKLIMHEIWDVKTECKNLAEVLLNNFSNKNKSQTFYFNSYNTLLYKKGEEHFFILNNEKFTAKIVSVDETGNLLLEKNHQLLQFNYQQIKFVY